MDLVPSCREKLSYFRIKELKVVLTQLGVSKQGRKQVLVDRILSLLLDEPASKLHGWAKKNWGQERVAKVIDDTYRKMHEPVATDLASKCQSNLVNNLKPKKELDDSYQLDMKVRCPCGISLLTDSMIKCEDPRCQVWQHIGCVIIPEKPAEGAPPEVPPCFYCEICRVNRADPFWLTIAHPLLPVKVPSFGIAADGTNTIQTLERTFLLTRADRELLQRTEFDLQVWCILLNDKVPCRMQWPLYSELVVNGISMRTVNRPGSQLLGINGRDDGPVIRYSVEGINKICLSRCDARVFCFGIRIASRQTVHQVLNMVPGEADGEHFRDALARVRRCIGCGTATENADSDSDIEVVADFVTVNLRCPMSGSRMKIAGRFKPCAHMGCFDLETFVELNQQSRKWQCPICLKNYSLDHIIIDPYFNRITSLLQNCGDVNEIDVKPDGSWRVKNGGEYGDLAKWHLPNGIPSVAVDTEVKPGFDIIKHIKQQSFSEGSSNLKLGIKRNYNGTWEVSKVEDFKPPLPGNHVQVKFQNHFQNIIPMSSSATGSYREGEDPSVNQEGWGRFDFSMNNGQEIDSLPLNFDPTFNAEEKIPSKPQKDVEIIVLSDSDDDDVAIISPRNAYDIGPAHGNGVIYAGSRPLTAGACSETVLGTSGTSCLDLFNNDNDDFEMPFWAPQTSPGFQLFGTDAGVSNSIADVQRQSLDGPPFSGSGVASGGGLGDTSHTYDLSNSHSHAVVDGGQVDNPIVLGSYDSLLQIFLSSQPAPAPVQTGLSDCSNMVSGVHSDDWISLRLGDAGRHPSKFACTNGLKSRQPFTSQKSGMEALADAASLLRGTSDDRVNKATLSDRRSNGPFSPPRRPRSGRPRLNLSVDRF